MFPGFDISEWDGRLIWMWQWSNLRFVGFYLAHSASGTITTWTRHRYALSDVGWSVIPIWLPFSHKGINAMSTSNGTAHGIAAVARAREAHFEHGSTIYLDVEAPIDLAGRNSPFVPYLQNWIKEIKNAGYAPGIYCSRLNAGNFLNRPEFRPFNLVIWPFSIATKTRAGWDNDSFQLMPVVANEWLVKERPYDPDGGQWPQSNYTVGCQFDWFNASRDRKIFYWAGPDGHPQKGNRDVDWNMAKVFDPAHPLAAGVIAITNDRNNADWAYLIDIRVTYLSFFERTASGRFTSRQELTLGAGDIGPRSNVSIDNFDPVSASATSRRHMHADFFLLGQDGFIRTIWINTSERFPPHSWPLNPLNPARRGSPIAAVSRATDQLDVFYVDKNHRLVTQWWNPRALRWDLNIRILTESSLDPKRENHLVAGGSNLVALPTPNDSIRLEDRLDVFYVSLNYAQPYSDSHQNQHWDNAWGVVHAAWTPQTDWKLSRIPNLIKIAGSSGIAAIRDATGVIHVVVQGRDRTFLSHARLAPTINASWIVHNGPSQIPLNQNYPSWWMSLYLCTLEGQLLLFGITNSGFLAWSLFAQNQWTNVATAPTHFCSARPLAYSRRGTSLLDIIGIDEDGKTIAQSLSITQSGIVNINSADGLPG